MPNMPAPGDSPRERILVIDADEAQQSELLDLLQSAVYDVFVTGLAQQGLETARLEEFDLIILSTNVTGRAGDWTQVVTELKGAAQTEYIRVIVLAVNDAAERIRALDFGADDVLSRPFEPRELLARVRRQIRARRKRAALERSTQLAEESYQIAQTALEGLAVTQKMARDARSLGAMLRRGVLAMGVLAVIMAGIYLAFFRTASREAKNTRALLAQIQSGITSEQNLLERTRKLRDEIEKGTAASLEEQKQKLESEKEKLREQVQAGAAADSANLRKQLDDTTQRLARLENEGKVAQGIIRQYAQSVCLLHVSIAFRDKQSTQRLRYVGLNPQGEPIQDSEGTPLLSLTGRGPEVRADFFGTGFLVSSSGKILTNRHVAEPWWKNSELTGEAMQGLEPVLAEMSAYFPGAAEGIRARTVKVSPEVDLAVLQGELGSLKRAVLQLDGSAQAGSSGQPVVLMGYATGLDAILARAGEDTVRNILQSTSGDARQIMTELAKRNLIRPLTTQGHIGDVLADKIVYDAQTASGGSGGPLFNREGKVIGVNFAVVRGFGGSNFGIPIRYADVLLK